MMSVIRPRDEIEFHAMKLSTESLAAVRAKSYSDTWYERSLNTFIWLAFIRFMMDGIKSA